MFIVLNPSSGVSSVIYEYFQTKLSYIKKKIFTELYSVRQTTEKFHKIKHVKFGNLKKQLYFKYILFWYTLLQYQTCVTVS